MAGDWEQSRPRRPAHRMRPATADADARATAPGMRRWYAARSPAGEQATLAGAKANIARHYDLSDELFALFLDPTMTYSSAVFGRPGDALADAQQRKIAALLDLTSVGPGAAVLEIGTGWGELALQAAARGARVTTLTISPRAVRQGQGTHRRRGPS